MSTIGKRFGPLVGTSFAFLALALLPKGNRQYGGAPEASWRCERGGRVEPVAEEV